MALSDLSGAAKEEMVVSLAALVLADSGVDMSADNLNAVVSASGNDIAPYWSTLFASFLEKAGGVDKFCGAPGAGGGGAAPAAGGAGGAAAEEAPKEEEKKEESAEDIGGMDMFGGGESDY
uniref:60S acidic ribosomal protein P1 n=1 Tax=Fibrocapsa japonica TaxID=94617 RepID=A0A7S2UUV6_9STRA|mmetsp:Transcript_12014/g.17707  ORF Transcript_12014/g.17707 Transcript_12014/m.17707 type:complete len:121 (+) Transcript_12014:94-456(+)